MPWFNADSKMHAHPKMREAGLEAMGLWIVAGTYSADLLTDGFVPDWYVETWPRGHKIATQLIVARLWERDKLGAGYRILSWNEYQRSREQVEADRAKWRERQKRARDNNRRERDDG